MSRLKLMPPPPTDAEYWKRLLSRLYLYEEDALFVWAKLVREAVIQAEKERAKRGRAA